jgi:hypothetical protein
VAWPDGHVETLADCGNKREICLSAGRSFWFAFPRHCGQVLVEGTSEEAAGKVIVALHNDAWVVFDQSPHVLFRYSAPAGVREIYIPRTENFDFRTLLQRDVVDLESGEFDKYAIAEGRSLAACN